MFLLLTSATNMVEAWGLSGASDNSACGFMRYRVTNENRSLMGHGDVIGYTATILVFKQMVLAPYWRMVINP